MLGVTYGLWRPDLLKAVSLYAYLTYAIIAQLFLRECLSMLCRVYSIADSVNFSILKSGHKLSFEQSPAKDVMFYHGEFDVFLFANGTAVFWDATNEQAEAFLEDVRSAFVNPFKQRVQDVTNYHIDPETDSTIIPSDKINNDVLFLKVDAPLLKLSFSYAFSRSIKLKSLEQFVENIIEKYAPLANSIYKRGKIALSRKGVLKIIGELMVAKTDINLVNNFTYLPVFFWQNPIYEKQFLLLEKYMDVEVRAMALNSRLNTLNEIFTLLNSYLEYRRSHFLEVAITVLVGMEVVFSFLNWHF